MPTARNKTKKKTSKKKINSKSKVVDGIEFASMLEADYYVILKGMEDNGEITELSLQPTFPLIDAFEVRGKKVQGMKYTPDFQYYKDGEKHIVETKGFATEPYKMRRKIFLNIYSDELYFHEVTRKGVKWKTRTW